MASTVLSEETFLLISFEVQVACFHSSICGDNFIDIFNKRYVEFLLRALAYFLTSIRKT